MGRALCRADSARGVCGVTLTETPIAGAWLLEIQPISDERGFFARSLCVDTLAAHGLEGRMQQQSVSFNQRRGTLRGMHYQSAPHEEIKLVRVTQGRIYDVILDLRRDSPSYLRWHAVELSASPKAWRTAFRPWKTTRKCFTRWRRPMCLATAAVCAGMTRRSPSTGRWRRQSYRNETPATLTFPLDEDHAHG